jgi:hypothetical protein
MADPASRLPITRIAFADESSACQAQALQRQFQFRDSTISERQLTRTRARQFLTPGGNISESLPEDSLYTL